MFRSVVFPAPFGPMMDRISPLRTSTLTRVTAWTPPKALDTSLISSWLLMDSPGLGCIRCSPGAAITTVSAHHGRHGTPAVAAPARRGTEVLLLVMVQAESRGC